MENVIIVAILAVILFFAVKSTIKHMKGEGECCGGPKEPKAKKKKLEGPIVAEKILHIYGMHCVNCQNRIEKALNQMEGVSAKVNLEKNIAVVTMDRNISDEILKITVENLDFKVTEIETKEV